MLIHKFAFELLVQKTLERRLFEMEEEVIKVHFHPSKGSDFIPSMVSQKSRLSSRTRNIPVRLEEENQPNRTIPPPPNRTIPPNLDLNSAVKELYKLSTRDVRKLIAKAENGILKQTRTDGTNLEVTGSDFIPSMVSQKSRVCKQIEDRLACEGSPGSFHKDFHLVDLDADITSRVEVNPSSNLPLRGFDPAQSSNGVLLLEYTNIDIDVQKCIVFNPVTGEYVRLLETVYPCRNARCALFYNPETNQFKVFRVLHRSSPSDATSDSLMELDSSSDFALNSHSETVIDLVSDPVSKLLEQLWGMNKVFTV